MKTKTCGECRIYDHFHNLCVIGGDIEPTETAKGCFEPKTITNGDKLIAGGMGAIAEFAANPCEHCRYYEDFCELPFGKMCEDAIKEYLNAPAESEVEDDTARD